MKKFALILAFAMVFGCLLGGCRRSDPKDTVPSTSTQTNPTPSSTQTEPSQPAGSAETGSAQILGNIWAKYADADKFAAFGGAAESAISDAPGDLDMSASEEITARYLVPQDMVPHFKNGASLVHMMNNNIFTGVVFEVADSADARTIAKAWRDNIQQNRWICGQPDRVVIGLVDGQLLMAFGASDVMETFQTNMTSAYADAEILYNEAIVA